MPVSEDASTPAVATTAGGSAATTLASASFSPPAGSVLVAGCLINYSTAPGTFPGIAVSDSASGTWTAGPSVSLASAFSKAAFFTRPCVSAPGSITVTMSRGADTGAAMLMLAVRVLDGANAGSPQGAGSTSSGLGTGAGFQVATAVTPQATGSLIYVLADYANNNAPTVISGTNSIQSTGDAPDGGELNAGRSDVTASVSAQTLGWTVTLTSAQGYVAAALEILAAGAAAAAPPPLVVPQAAVMQAANW